MEITKELYETHQRLSACSVKFLDFVKDNPMCLQRSHFEPSLSQRHEFWFTRFQSWPTFINKKTKETLKEAALKVYQLIKAIPERLFSYDINKISDYYELPKDITEMLIYGVDKAYLDSLLGRGDFIFTPSGQLKCIEFNVQANMGGWELDIIEPKYINIPVISKFLEENNVKLRHNQLFRVLTEHVLRSFLEKSLKLKRPEINIAIAFPGLKGIAESSIGANLQNLYKTILQREPGALKGNFIICGYDVLKIIDQCLFCGDMQIDILIEMSNGNVPLFFMLAVKAGNLMLYNGPIQRLISNKLNIALLSEHQHSGIFTAEEQEVIKAYIPWTRKVIPGDTIYGTGKIKLEDFICSHRERMVLKSAEGLAGEEVYIGSRTPPDQWRQMVEKAMAEKTWVIQEYIPSPSFLYQTGENDFAPHQTVWGLFAFGNHYAGGFVRILPEKNNKGVINTKQGAEKSIVLEIEE